MKTPKFIENISWSDLREQKAVLNQIISWKQLGLLNDSLEGIISLIDAVQDYAVDEMGIDENIVFDFENDSIEESTPEDSEKCTAGLHVGETKTVWLCPHCNSDNTELKMWVNANTDVLSEENEVDPDEGWCNDCQQNGELYESTLLFDTNVIGFQVVGIEGMSQEGNIHPDMDASFCIYSLSQCNEMLMKSNTSFVNFVWRLDAIWSNDIEEPTMMFEGDPRN